MTAHRGSLNEPICLAPDALFCRSWPYGPALGYLSRRECLLSQLLNQFKGASAVLCPRLPIGAFGACSAWAAHSPSIDLPLTRVTGLAWRAWQGWHAGPSLPTTFRSWIQFLTISSPFVPVSFIAYSIFSTSSSQNQPGNVCVHYLNNYSAQTSIL